MSAADDLRIDPKLADEPVTKGDLWEISFHHTQVQREIFATVLAMAKGDIERQKEAMRAFLKAQDELIRVRDALIFVPVEPSE